MMNEEMMKQMPGMMGHPVAKGAMMAATGYAATRAVVSHGLFRSPLMLLAGGIAGGVALGYLLHKHEKDVVLVISKAIGMGKDFVMQQRENLDDLVAEAKETEAQAAPAAAAAAEPGNDAQA
jgi:hypothetical protein